MSTHTHSHNINNNIHPDILNAPQDFTNKKRLVKLFFWTVFTTTVISNALFGWAAPQVSVPCCQDVVLEFINHTFSDYSHYKLLPGVLTLLFVTSDVLFLHTLYKFILCKGNLKFIIKLSTIVLIKMAFDIMFYQSNIYTLDHKYDLLAKYSLINNLHNNSSSLFSLSISMQFLSLKENSNDKTTPREYKMIMTIILVISVMYFLFSNMFFAFQIIFSFLAVDYIHRLTENYVSL